MKELRKNNLSISAVMVGNLALLHRYTLVRTHVKIGDHHQAAKLLIQVAANISRFPARKNSDASQKNYSTFSYFLFFFFVF